MQLVGHLGWAKPDGVGLISGELSQELRGAPEFPQPNPQFNVCATFLDRLPIVRAILDPASLLDTPPEEALPRLARAYLATADRPSVPRILRLIVPEVIRRPEIAELVSKQVIVRILEFLKTYLTRQIELGRLRPHDVRASARAFMGMLLPQLGGKLLLPALQQDGLTDEEHIATIVTIFLRGLEPARAQKPESQHERESENDQ